MSLPDHASDGAITLDQGTLRIIDASLNRATEGLRVVEDFVRFTWGDAHLCRQFKTLRHELAEAAALLPPAARFSARDTPRDVGTTISQPSELLRSHAWQVCLANLERAKQALRTLEEFGKLVSVPWATAMKGFRYRLYSLEGAVIRTGDAQSRLAAVRLCVLIPGGESDEALTRQIRELVAAGVDMLQLRDKRLSTSALVRRARALRLVAESHSANAGHRVVTIVNDRPDVAAAAGLDGVHVGQDDMAVADARTVVGPHRLVGVSTHSLDQARQAVMEGANYLGAGPVFPSTTKSFERFSGLDYLRQVAAEITLPTLAIGGIDGDNLASVLETGVKRIAVSHAVVGSANPAQAAGEFAAALRR